jgi:hypothetical protein
MQTAYFRQRSAVHRCAAEIAGKHAKGAAENVEKLSLRRPGGHPYPIAEASFDSRFKGVNAEDRSGSAFLLAGK